MRGGGDAAEDLLQDIWLKVTSAKSGPVGNPLAYLYDVANHLMIDRYRSQRQATLREHNWAEVSGGSDPDVSEAPGADRVVIGRAELELVAQALSALGPRVDGIFRRHRIDGLSQRQVADEFGVSVSTVESDLRRAYLIIAKLRERYDDA